MDKVRYLKYQMVRAKDNATNPNFWYDLGCRVQNYISYPKVLGTIAGCVGLFLISKEIFNFSKDFSFQSMGKPVAKDERVNPWTKDDYELTNFDVNPMSVSYKGLTVEQVSDIVFKNTVYLRINRPDDAYRPTKAVCLCGQLYMLNAHAIPNDIPDDEFFEIQIISQPFAGNTDGNITLKFKRNQFLILPGDLAFIQIKNIPPRKDISALFVKDSYNARSNGYYISRDVSGRKIIIKTSKITREKRYVGELQNYVESFKSIPERPTTNGDCGSVLIAQSEMGPIVCGIHFLGKESVCEAYAIRTTFEAINKVIDMYGPRVQSGTPSFESDSVSRKLGNLAIRAPIRWIESGNVEVYGSFEGFRPCPKSRVEKTILNEALTKEGYETLYTAPKMKGYMPWNLSLNELVHPANNFDNNILEDCAMYFVKDILGALPKDELALIEPYDMFTAINGAQGIAYVDSLNFNTSSGFPWRKTKKHLLVDLEPQHGLEAPKDVCKEVKDRVHKIIENGRKGIRSHPIFTASLKDEAVTFDKAERGKTRIFTGAPLDFTIAVRMKYLSTIRVIQRNRFVFEAAPGTNATSLEWEQIHDYLTKFGPDRIVAGDFSKFDKRMGAIMILMAFGVLIEIMKASGNFDNTDILEAWTYAYDMAFAWIDFNGDLMQFFGGNPSGHPLTAIINCIANSLYMRYVYAVKSPEGTCERFREHVNLMTYGDDNGMGVSKEIDFFNHTIIHDVLLEVGIEYTMADKESESVPFVHIKDITFLKRRWRYDPDVGAILAPLEFDSIQKSLMVWVRSKTVSEQEQAIAIIGSAIREFFFHGKIIFIKQRKLLMNVVVKLELNVWVQDSTFPEWENLKESFWENSEGMSRTFDGLAKVKPRDHKGERDVVFLNQNISPESSYCTIESETFSETESESGDSVETHHGDPKSPYLGKSPVGTQNMREFSTIKSKPSNSMKERLSKIFNINTKVSVPDYKGTKSGVDSPHLQTGDEKGEPEIASTNVSSDNDTQGTLHYVDEAPGEKLEFNPILDNSFYNDYSIGTDLGEFLSRPVLINTITWKEGTAIDVSMTPWSLFFGDARIKKKLDNYAFISCNLNIKIMINASPFYYGLVYATYTPLQVFTPSTIQTVTNGIGHLVPMSQLPHICIYPQNCQGGEMKLPFFYHKNWMRVTSLNEFAHMGKLDLDTFVSLYNANSTTSQDCTIQIYAWASDVRLSGPTAGLALQAKDEYSKKHIGPVSAPASAVAEAAGKLGRIPVIGQYMTATSMAARSVADIAAWFGYTNVPNIGGSEPMKNVPFHAFASPEISTPVEKLSMDPKNEVTIDPRVTGLPPVDEMVISKFVQRESWIMNSMWAAIDGVDTILFKSRILPEMIRIDGTLPRIIRQATPMAHVNQMFSYWRGDIIFRFRIICTKFHKGRLRITWDPEADIVTDSVTSTVAFTRIVDISQEHDFEIRVPYMQAVGWLKCANTVDVINFGSGSGILTHDPLSDNGILTCRVFTQQTSSVAAAPIWVVVNVRAADNMEFAAPRDIDQRFSPYVLQSQDELEYDSPSTIIAGDVPQTPNPFRYLVNHGEAIPSFRQVLRRTCFVQAITCNVSTTGNKKQSIHRYTLARAPSHYGYDPSGPYLLPGIITPGTNYRANYVKNVPYTFLAPCFVGNRGSHIWHINTDVPQSCGTIEVQRRRSTHTNSNLLNSQYLADTASAGLVGSFNHTHRLGGFGGLALSNQNSQTGLSVLLPMYSQYRFLTNDCNSTFNGSARDGSDEDSFSITIVTKPSFNNSLNPEHALTLNLYHSVGTDFSFHFFLNVPSLFIYTLPTPSA